MPKNSKKAQQARTMALETGAGILTAAALAAGAAYLLSGKKRQAKAKAWVVKTRREIAANIKRARKMHEVEYKRIVDAAVKRYGSLSDANKAELAGVATDLKNEWQRLQKVARTAKTSPKKGSRVKVAIRKTTKRKRAK